MVNKIKRLVGDHRRRPHVNKSEVDSYAEAGSLMDGTACCAHDCSGVVCTESATQRLAQGFTWD